MTDYVYHALVILYFLLRSVYIYKSGGTMSAQQGHTAHWMFAVPIYICLNHIGKESKFRHAFVIVFERFHKTLLAAWTEYWSAIAVIAENSSSSR